MSTLKHGPKWRVTKRFPNAYALKQQWTGRWKVFTGAHKDGNRCIGEGVGPSGAWMDSAGKLHVNEDKH